MLVRIEELPPWDKPMSSDQEEIRFNYLGILHFSLCRYKPGSTSFDKDPHWDWFWNLEDEPDTWEWITGDQDPKCVEFPDEETICAFLDKILSGELKSTSPRRDHLPF